MRPAERVFRALRHCVLCTVAIMPVQSEHVCDRGNRNTRTEGLRMRAYGEMEQHGKYTLEDYGGWSRNHTKAASIRRWKRPLKKRARQVCRAMLRRMER
ncbi:hypothetical protein FMM75_21590 [Lachnospiraceae bacterium MD335]|nr:hypothetical protein [Lachnospiraceae bacterium MD335]